MSTHILFGRSSFSNESHNKWFETSIGEENHLNSKFQKHITVNLDEKLAETAVSVSNEEVELVLLGSPYGINGLEDIDLTQSKNITKNPRDDRICAPSLDTTLCIFYHTLLCTFTDS